MAEPRPFPPSPRRLALARASGLTAASPLLVGGAALVAGVVVLVGLGRAAAAQLGGWTARAMAAADGAIADVVGSAAANSGAGADASQAAAAATASASQAAAAATASASQAAAAATASAAANGAAGASSPLPAAGPVLHVDGIARAVLELALPLVGAVAIAAVVVHLAQTRALWLPRRRSLPGAPTLPRHTLARTSLDLVGAFTIGAVCLGWLWMTAPQLAALVQSPLAAGAALAALLTALAIAWIALGVIDALVRSVQLANALAMTRTEKREDDRLAAADPRWRAQQLSVLRGNLSDAVARSVIVVLGDDAAVAIAWDPVRQPTPLRTATGRAARATQLLALARRHRVRVQRDAALAARLVAHEGPVPDAEWGALAELVAAVRR